MARNEAFSCSRAITELEALGHTGAASWIRRFDNATNNTGRPLVECLARAGMHWYEMNAEALADLVMPLNFGERLFVSKLDPPAFVNQRLVRLNARADVDIELCHALLNSAISLFMVEGMGFGRGAGVLDLSKDRIEDFMHMLNPAMLNLSQVQQIITAFDPLRGRELLQIADELDKDDRQNFDDTVIQAFGLSVSREQIYDSLLRLVGIRQTATETFD